MKNVSLPVLVVAFGIGIISAGLAKAPLVWLVLLVFSFVGLAVLLVSKRLSKIAVYVLLVIMLSSVGAFRAGIGGNDTIESKDGNKVEVSQIRLIDRAREYIRRSTYRFLPREQASLMMGILLGDTSGISEELREDFQRTGLTHILAVSGMNVGILVAVTLFLLKFSPGGQLLQFSAISALVAYYTALTQFQPSVLRASLMALVGLGAYVVGRRHNLINSLFAAAFILLLYDPLFLYSISFQLSFAATLAIIVLMPTLEGVLDFLPKMIKETLGMCLAAQLGVVPLLSYHFGQLSAISLLANVLVVPATYPVLILGMISPVFSVVSTELVRTLSWLAGCFLFYIIAITRLLSSVPFASFSLSSPSLFFIVFYYLVLALVFWWVSKNKKTHLALLLIVVLSFVVVFMGCELGKGKPPTRLTVTFIDVGQGDATLIQAPEGQTVLIDGGQSSSTLSSFLNSQGVGKIDLLILSHPHADHVGSLAWLVLNRRIDMVLDGGQAHTSRLYLNFLKVIEKRDITYKLARRGQTFKVGPKLTVEVLAPEDTFITGTASDLNNNSVVVRVTYGKFSLLFPGDIEKAGEGKLIRSGVNLKATVLKVPHHGSSNGGDRIFLEAVHSEVVVISVGENEFGHPARSTLNRLKDQGAEIYRTDRNGNVTILSDGTTFEVRTER